MRITRHTQACVEVEVDGVRLVVDPGAYGPVPDLAAADAVLVTHDHEDHLDRDALRAARAARPDLLVLGPAGLGAALDPEVREVAAGDVVEVGAVPVEAVGRLQAVASLEDGPIPNVGYLIGGRRLLHPGDAYQAVDGVDVLLLPMNGPWVKRPDQEAHLRAHPPRRIVGIHDVQLGELGLDFADRTLQALAAGVGAEAVPLRVGESAEL